MKKFLFTLASLIAFGFAANAGAPELGFSTNLVDLTPGGDPVEVKVLLTKDAGEVVAGGQLQFVLRDAAGNITEDVVVVRQNLGTPRVPNYQYFRPGVIMDDMGVPVASSNPYPGKFRILLANTSTNIVMMGDELEYYGGQGIEPVLCTFQLQANESWDGEYVTVNLECNPKSMEEQGEDEYPNKWSIPGGSQVVADGAMEPIEVDNTAFTPAGPTALTGTVTIGEADGYQVPITVDVNGTYTLEVTVAKDGGDPVVVEVVDGKITLGANPEYGTYVINATATGTGDYEGTVSATPKTVIIAQQKLDDPEIDFEVGETGVTINVTGATRYEVWVGDVNMGEINFVEEDWTEQQVVVKAWNEADLYIPGYAEKSTTVGVKDNYELEGDITISAVDEDGQIYVAYTGNEEVVLTATINGEAVDVVNGYIQLPDFGTYTVVVTATATADHYNPLVSDPEEREWVEPGTADTPNVEFVPGETGVTINVTDATSWEVIVDDVNMGQINFVEKTWEEQHIVVNATNAPTGFYPAYSNGNEYTLAPKANYDLEGDIIIGAVEQETGKIYVMYDGDEDVTIAVTIEGVREVQNIGKAGYVQLPAPGKYNVTAVATAVEDHYNTLTEGPVEREWLEPETTTAAPNITTAVDEENHNFVVTATGANPDDEVTLTVTIYPNDPAEQPQVVTVTGTGSVSYPVAQTDQIQYISYWASALNPADDNPGVNNGAQYVEVPAYIPETPDQQTLTPNIRQVGDGFIWDANGLNNYAYWIEITDDDPNAAIEYRIIGPDGSESEWMPYTGQFILHGENGEYTIEARAKNPELLMSNTAVEHYTIESIPTSINELMSAENVANVRFFNVAGQEMQEANGLTIVVVTYNNGSTVAMKLMK
jgi:hypothetical protein